MTILHISKLAPVHTLFYRLGVKLRTLKARNEAARRFLLAINGRSYRTK